MTHYDVSLTVDPANQTISGRAILNLDVTDLTAPSFYLHLTKPQISAAIINGDTVSFIRSGDKVYFSRTDQSPQVTMSIDYAGAPGNDGFGGFFFAGDYAFTTGEGLNSPVDPSMLRHWVPSHDVPFDKATLDIKITVPQNLKAFSNGRLLSTSNQNSQTTFHWQEVHPIATYLIAIAAGPYETLSQSYTSVSGRNLPLEFYVFPQDVELAGQDWANLPGMMAFFEANFSPYSFDRYSMAEAYNRGAMEHQTMTTYSSQLITGDNRYDYIMAHELAHHWWGDLVTLGNWRDIWLNEGFATYSEALYFESLYGQDYLAEYMNYLFDIYLAEVARRGHFPVYDPDYMWGGTIYEKGAWVLHMLRRQVGDDIFWQVLQTLANRFAYGNAVTSDFKNLAEELSGQNLDWFFDQWIYQAGYPELNIAWEYQKNSAADYTTTVVIEQQQWQQFQFKLPVEVLFETRAGTVLDTLWSETQRQTFTVQLHSEPLAIHIDPDNWLLKQYDIVSEPSIPGIMPNDFYLAQNYPNPFLSGQPTQIVYQVAQINSPHPVSLKIYNILGQHVTTLVNQPLHGGAYTTSWDGRDKTGRMVASGLYFMRLLTPSQQIVKKLVIVEQ